jgi:hypothetical protein
MMKDYKYGKFSQNFFGDFRFRKNLPRVFKTVKGYDKLDPERIFPARIQYQNSRQSANPWKLAPNGGTIFPKIPHAEERHLL